MWQGMQSESWHAHTGGETDQNERRFVLKDQEDFERLLHFVLQEEEFGGHRVAGDFLIAYKVDFACWLSYPKTCSPIWNKPGKNNARISIAVYDRTSLQMVRDLNVSVTVFDENGMVIGQKEHPFLYRPHHNQYGTNWELPGDGKYSLRVRIEAPAYLRAWDGQPYTSPVTVEFSNVEVCTGRMIS